VASSPAVANVLLAVVFSGRISLDPEAISAAHVAPLGSVPCGATQLK
jgi:hypothetical protein